MRKAMIKTIKFLAVAAAAAALLAGCQKSPRAGRPVGFVVENSVTKGSVVTTSSINVVGQKFLIDLIETNTKAIITDCDGDQVLGKEVTCESVTSSKGNWSMYKYVYWNGQTMDAWARYPISLNGSMGLTESLSGGHVSSYQTDSETGQKVSINEDRTAMQFNYLTFHSNAGTDAENQDDLLFAHSYQRKSTTLDGRIPINFNHALSAIYFKIGTDTDGYETGDNVRIDAISINGVKRAGSCTYTPVRTFANGKITMSDAQFDGLFTWDTSTDGDLDRSVGSYKQNFNQKATPGAILGGSAFGHSKTFFLIPQTMTDDASLTINWSTTDDGTNWTSRDPLTAQIKSTKDKDNNPYIVTWKAGYKYLYTVKIKHHGADVEIDIQAEDWDRENIETSYESGAAASVTGKLQMYEGVVAKPAGRVSADAAPVKCTFKLDAPTGGRWIVSLTDSEHFSLSYDGVTPATGTTVSGEISDEDAEFYVIGNSTNRSVDYTTQVRIAARRIDGTTISADEVLGSEDWTIVLPARL